MSPRLAHAALARTLFALAAELAPKQVDAVPSSRAMQTLQDAKRGLATRNRAVAGVLQGLRFGRGRSGSESGSESDGPAAFLGAGLSEEVEASWPSQNRRTEVWWPMAARRAAKKTQGRMPADLKQ